MYGSLCLGALRTSPYMSNPPRDKNTFASVYGVDVIRKMHSNLLTNGDYKSASSIKMNYRVKDSGIRCLKAIDGDLSRLIHL